MWKTVKLGDICKIVNGSTPSRKEKTFWEDGDISWFTIDDMREQGRDIFTTAQHVTQRAVEEKKVKLVSANSVLLCCTASIGEAAIARKEMATNQQFNSLTPLTNDLSCEYLYYVATTLKDKLLRVSGSTTISFVSMGKLKEIEIPLPPLAEQQRIVAKLDAAFAEIDRAVKATEKEISEGEKLVGKYIDKLMEADGDVLKIADLSTSVTDGDHQPPPKSKHGVPFITISNVNKKSRKIDFSNTFFVPQSYYDNLKETRKPQRGDILYTVTGSFGIPVLIESNSVFCFQRHIAIIRPKPSVDSEWLYYALLSSSVFRQADEKANGAAQRTVSLKTLREIIVKVPDIEKQRSDLLKIKSLENHQQRFVSQKKQSLESLLALKSAILAQELQPPKSEAA